MNQIELENINGTTLESSSIGGNEDVYIEIKMDDTFMKNSNEFHIKKVGGGGPDEPKFIPMFLTIISALFFTALNDYMTTVQGYLALDFFTSKNLHYA